MENEIIIEDIDYDLTDVNKMLYAVSILFKEGKYTYYLSMVEEDHDNVYFYTTNEYILDKFTDYDEKSYREFEDFMHNHYLYEYNGIDLQYEFKDLLKNLNEEKDNIDAKLLKLALVIVRLDYEVANELIKNSKGKNLKDIELPTINY